MKETLHNMHEHVTPQSAVRHVPVACAIPSAVQQNKAKPLLQCCCAMLLQALRTVAQLDGGEC
jgi:hypothetical protein